MRERDREQRKDSERLERDSMMEEGLRASERERTLLQVPYRSITMARSFSSVHNKCQVKWRGLVQEATGPDVTIPCLS